MYCFYCRQQLLTQTNSCADCEATFWLAAAKFGEIATLKVHHHIVEFLIATTADKSANVILTYNNKMLFVIFSDFVSSLFL